MTLKQTTVVVRDVFGITGAGLIAYGAWLIYNPAGFVVGGVILLAGAIAAARGGG